MYRQFKQEKDKTSGYGKRALTDAEDKKLVKVVEKQEKKLERMGSKTEKGGKH